MFTRWLSDRQLHEDKTKTIITELTSEGQDGRYIHKTISIS